MTQTQRPPEAQTPNGPHAHTSTTTPDSTGTDWRIGSRQVSWWSVHEFVTGLLAAAASWPLVGTPAWCELPDGDLRKIAAVFDAAQHWALRMETCQEARVDAREAISAAHNWKHIAQWSFRRDCAIEHGTYIPRVKS
jgi:hypothetical protein